MVLFKRKPKLSIEECFKGFFEGDLNVEGWSGYLDEISKLVTEADQSFSLIDPQLFKRELTALRMELFELAWTRRFKEESAIAENFFTRQYLDENGTLDIWDAMGEYNQVIARSAITNENNHQMDKARTTHLDLERVKLFTKWATKSNIPATDYNEEDKERAKCIARVANRIGADFRRADGIALRLLCAWLADRLGCDVGLSAEALLRLSATIFGLYNGAEEYLESVHLA